MSNELNKAVTRRLYEDFWGQGRFELVEELFTPDCVNHQHLPQLHGAFANDILRGPLAYLQLVQAWRSAFPDARTRIDDQVADRDRVVTRWHTTGTHQGRWMGIEGTGREIEVAGISIDRLFGGRIVETWTSWDVAGLLEQLGAATWPSQATREHEVMVA